MKNNLGIKDKEPMNLLFHEHLSRLAGTLSLHPALCDEQGTLTYLELEELTNDLADSLLKAGFKANEAAAVFVSRQKEILVGAIAIMKAGGIFLPLDEGYPNERLSYMMEDAGVHFVLADRTLAQERKEAFANRQILYFDEAERRQDFSPLPRRADDPVMILYTSGTTGKPKGVVHRHALLQNVNDWMLGHEELAFEKNSHMGIMSGFTFVATNVFMFGTLREGGTVHIAPNEVKQNTDILYTYIKEKGITHIFMPSSLTAAMAEEYDLGGITLFAGGEKLRNFTLLSPETRVYNMYGSTELATIFSIRVHGDEVIMPIGYLTKGDHALLVDEELQPVGENEVGELLISDPRMSHQYLHLPEQTAEKWIEREGKLYFRTGDRMRRDENGIYYILGRIDNMVKLRGFRIETGEVETQVAKTFGELGMAVGQVVVAVRTINGIEHLACYYESAVSYDEKKLAESLARFLPAYMMPDLWIAMDAMPRNANGKVIRAELPEPTMGIHFLGAILSEVELRVVEAAGAVLHLEGAIDPEDSFVQLGGDSLGSMKLASLLGEQGICISGAKILALDSLREVAQAADVRYERLWSVKEYEAVKYAYLAHGEHICQVLPLSARQDDLLCRQLIHPDSPVSEHRFLFVLESSLQEQDLRQVLDTLSAAHPSMRSSIACRDVSIFQCVITDRRIPLTMIHSEEKDIAAAYSRLSREDEMKPFDLQFSPMFRVACLDRQDAPSSLLVCANKAIYELTVLRRIFAQMMELLQSYYPQDQEISTWKELLEYAVREDEEEAKSEGSKAGLLPLQKQEDNKEIFIYSDTPEKKIFFVHTGNTGSSAYYQLAQRIRDMYFFAVVEPYNLYHRNNVLHGIKEIAAKYIEIIKKYQPEGPYILGGWCYGGVVAHEMACQLEEKGEKVENLILLDAHALNSDSMRALAAPMQAGVGRRYFETCPLFKELRENGMLEAMIENAAQVTSDINSHVPKMYHGKVTYFKPENTPAAAKGDVLRYWQEMMKKQAGNYENYCERDKLTVILTPSEHDEMMEADSLDIIVPKLYEVLG